jgi:hypothetical protein
MSENNPCIKRGLIAQNIYSAKVRRETNMQLERKPVISTPNITNWAPICFSLPVEMPWTASIRRT